MMGKKSRTKGHAFERFIATELRVKYPQARRLLEYQIEDCQGTDLQDTGPFRIQCKKEKSYAPINRIEEVKCTRPDQVPLLVTAGDNKEPIVAIYLSDFLKLLNGAN